VDECAVEIRNVTARYGDKVALEDVSLVIPARSIYAFIGPSGCGKTTLLRSINRLNDFVRGFALEGEIIVASRSIYRLKQAESVQQLRMHMGMVFQKPNPLPLSIMDNMVFPYREHIKCTMAFARDLAEDKLRMVGLFDEVCNKLDMPATSLSGGQQQRLCIARALMLPVELLLMDEPCSALDPISTFRIEDMLAEIRKEHTIIMVTHNMEQARRISDHTAFFYQGEVVEHAETRQLFSDPQNDLTFRYISGRV